MPINKKNIEELKAQFKAPCKPDFIDPGSDKYENSRKVFNRKFDFMPSLIIKVKTTEDVSKVVKFSVDNDMPFTVKSGGHDHEGESVATGKLLIDFESMNDVKIYEAASQNDPSYLRVQAGARFEMIKPALDDKHLAIAHGTCQTVAIAGYTLGGGWGPWTRMYGMGCERLTGATIVLLDAAVFSQTTQLTQLNTKLRPVFQISEHELSAFPLLLVGPGLDLPYAYSTSVLAAHLPELMSKLLTQSPGHPTSPQLSPYQAMLLR